MTEASSVRTDSARHVLSQRTARLVSYSGFALAALLPPLFWHRPISVVASDFRLELEYLITGWTAYTLIALGLLAFVPVLFSVGRSPGDRLYSRARNAYAGWAISLYFLGVALASQVAAVTGT